MDLLEKYLGEGSSKYKKQFIQYAKEIIENLVKHHDDMLGDAISFQKNARQLQVSIVTILGTMTQDGGSPAYAMYKKYMPRKFNKDIFKDGYQSEWFDMTDSMRFTIAREATLDYAKKKGYKVNRKDITIR